MKVVSYSYEHIKFYKGSHIREGNLGDAIQTLASIEFLNHKNIAISGFVDRKKLENHMFINGWHKYSNEILPNYAIFCSIHSDIEHLKKINKSCLVGCRDIWTKSNCDKINLQSVVTGCVTINLPPINSNHTNNNTIFIDSIYTDQNQYTQKIDINTSWSDQIKLAKSRLTLLSSASLVHTTRLHILIPCIAMGVPVILDQIIHDNDRFDFINKFIQIGKPIEKNDGIRDALLDMWNINSTKVLDSYFNSNIKIVS